MIDTDDHYYAHDHLYSVTALLDNTGQVTERYEYNAYGKATVYTDDGADDTWFTSDDTTANTSAQNNPYTFTSKRLDNLDSDTLQIMYYKNRYYDTETGRFLQRDPIGVMDELGILKFKQTGSPIIPRTFETVRQYIDGENLYQYVQSKPLIQNDPFGLDAPGCTPNDWAKNNCYRECCAIHDYCYETYKCTSKSWFGTIWKLRSPWKGRCRWNDCDDCNVGVGACFAKCAKDDTDDPDRRNFYCACHGYWFDDPRDPHMKHSTDDPDCINN